MTEPLEKGPITSAVYQLRRLVAESAAFQSRCGAADSAAAKKRVKCWDFEDDPILLQKARPFAVIWPADRFDLDQVAGGARNWLLGGGDLVLIISDVDRAAGDREASGAEFAGWIDAVLIDMADLAGDDDRIQLRHISFLRRPMRTATKDEASAGAFWEVAFLVSWGAG